MVYEHLGGSASHCASHCALIISCKAIALQYLACFGMKHVNIPGKAAGDMLVLSQTFATWMREFLTQKPRVGFVLFFVF